MHDDRYLHTKAMPASSQVDDVESKVRLRLDLSSFTGGGGGNFNGFNAEISRATTFLRRLGLRNITLRSVLGLGWND